jgi:DNA-binding transcriptional MerR regulator
MNTTELAEKIAAARDLGFSLDKVRDLLRPVRDTGRSAAWGFLGNA